MCHNPGLRTHSGETRQSYHCTLGTYRASQVLKDSVPAFGFPCCLFTGSVKAFAFLETPSVGYSTARPVRLGLAIHLKGLPAHGAKAVPWGMDYKELVLQYADSLKTDLTWASKTHINMLTMLAAENKAAAASICAAIERHILSVRCCTTDPFWCVIAVAVDSIHVCCCCYRLLLPASFQPSILLTVSSKMSRSLTLACFAATLLRCKFVGVMKVGSFVCLHADRTLAV